MIPTTALILVALFSTATVRLARAQAAADAGQNASLYQLDARLQRSDTCEAGIPAASSLTGRVVLDGSGRFVGATATKDSPAYWGRNVSSIEFVNQPSVSGVELSDDELTLSTDSAGKPGPWKLTRGSPQRIDRETLDPESKDGTRAGGLVQITVKRRAVVIETLWFIMEDSDVILLDSDGPVDSVYRSTTVHRGTFPVAPSGSSTLTSRIPRSRLSLP